MQVAVGLRALTSDTNTNTICVNNITITSQSSLGSQRRSTSSRSPKLSSHRFLASLPTQHAVRSSSQKSSSSSKSPNSSSPSKSPGSSRQRRSPGSSPSSSRQNKSPGSPPSSSRQRRSPGSSPNKPPSSLPGSASLNRSPGSSSDNSPLSMEFKLQVAAETAMHFLWEQPVEVHSCRADDIHSAEWCRQSAAG